MVLRPADVRDRSAIRTPDGKVAVFRHAPGAAAAAKLGCHPDVSAERSKLEDRAGGSTLDETRLRGPRRDKRDRIAIRRERRLDIVCGIVRDVYVLAALDPPDVDLEIAAAVGAEREDCLVCRPTRPIRKTHIMREVCNVRQ